MPELHKGRLSKPLGTAYDSVLSFKCPRLMTSAVEKTAQELGLTRASFLRAAVNHAVYFKLSDLDEEGRKSVEASARLYQEQKREEENGNLEEYDRNIVSFINDIKARKLYDMDYMRLKDYKEHVEKTKGSERWTTEELHKEWKRFSKSKKGKLVLKELENRDKQ